MRTFKAGSATAVFIVFFGLSLIEAFQSRNWVLAAVFLALAILSLRADALTRYVMGGRSIDKR